MKKQKIVAVSGGFDPVHKGHVRMIKEAAKLGKVVVILNNDNWLENKKGYFFMNEYERQEILENVKGVWAVIKTRHARNCADRSVCEALRELKPDIFCNGGDRYSNNIPEYKLCKELGIEMRFNVGGEKIQSSSELVKKANENIVSKDNKRYF